MNETELERLVVRLTGDASSYLKMLKEASDATKREAQEVSNQTTKMAKGFKEMGDAMKGGLAALGAKHFLESSLHSWEEQENAIIQLEAALKANGREVEELSKDYQKFASDMQAVSTTADEVYASLLKQAETFKLTGAGAKGAVKDAAALAAINDSSAEAMIRITSAMAKGDTETAMMFSRMIPQLRGIKDEAEFTSRYTSLVAAGMEVMGKKAETAGGRMEQLKNDFGDFKEQIGEVVARAIVPVAEYFSNVSKWLQTLPASVKTLTVTVIALGVGLATVATVGPFVVSQLKSITAASIEMGKAALVNPYTWLLIAAIAFRELTIHIIDQTEHLRKLNAAKEESMKLDDKLIKSMETKYGKEIKRASDAGPDSKEMKDLKEKLENDIKGAKQKLEDAQKAGESKLGTGLVRLIFPSTVEATEKEHKANIESAQKFVDGYEKEMMKLQKINEAKNKGFESPEMMKSFDEFMAKMRDEKAMIGMTTQQIEIYNITKGKMSEVNKNAAESALREVENMKLGADQVKEYYRLLGELADQRAKLNMTEEQKFAYDAPVSKEQKDILQKQMEEFNRDKHVKEIRDSDPKKRLAKEVEALDELLRMRKITEEEYRNELKKTTDSIMGVVEAKEKLKSRDAADSTSGEALARVQEYFSVQQPDKANQRKRDDEMVGLLGIIARAVSGMKIVGKANLAN